MAKCKYPNEVCANMTVLNGDTYCDSVPCSLKDDLPKQTNADRIRNMSDEELAEWIHNISHDNEAEEPNVCIYDLDQEKEIVLYDSYGDLLEWLQAEVKEGAE